MHTRKLIALVLLAGLGWTVSAFKPGEDKELTRLVGYMQGSFSSAAQAARDSSYFDIRLHMAPIWKKQSKGGHWLYVEQAMASRQEAPYRQRVYHVHRNAQGQLVSEVFTFSQPKRMAGQWKQPEPLTALTPDSLQLRTGCAIVLHAEGDAFVGKTGDKTCPSDLRGAAFATSEVRITPDKLLSWDRGFDSTGKQVWGATQGGYEFIKEKQ